MSEYKKPHTHTAGSHGDLILINLVIRGSCKEEANMINEVFYENVGGIFSLPLRIEIISSFS